MRSNGSHTSLRRGAAAIAAALALFAAGCGDDEETRDAAYDGTTAPADSATAPRGNDDPRSAIQSYFTALRLGQAEQACALESESRLETNYGGLEGCLQDEAKNNEQPVWAETPRIVSLEESGDRATAVVQPNATSNAEAQITLVRTEDGWLIDSFQ